LRIFDIQDEIEGIKFCARRLFSESRTFADEKQIRKYSSLVTNVDFEKLFYTESFDGFVSGLCGTPYETVLLRLKSDSTRQTLFDVETVLDLYYSRTRLLYINKYTKGKEQKLFKKLYGSETDLYNISTVIRAKQYYQIQNEEIYSLLYEGGYRLKKEDISRMVKAQSIEKLMQEIANTPYRKIFENSDTFFEDGIFNYIYELHRKNLKNEAYSNSAVISYIYLKKLEIKNLISVIENVRYKRARGVRELDS